MLQELPYRLFPPPPSYRDEVRCCHYTVPSHIDLPRMLDCVDGDVVPVVGGGRLVSGAGRILPRKARNTLWERVAKYEAH